MGRVNYGKFLNGERKGLLGDVLIDGKKQINWEMYPMEFKQPFIQAASASSKWQDYASDVKRPALYKATIDITENPPKDTFIDMKQWEKGVIFINGFNLGRYWKKGPQVTYYLPGPLLKTGKNEIIIFELHQSSSEIVFSDKHNLGPVQHVTDDDE
ncbi:beta-galactosidase-1-like protein 2 [Amphiura filiformis]|uniref:beta-galactosidase-1-like protein 2 n=1 Tax=Amphiura filiformis TaxID=82378 RepID=UPI003B20FBA4